MQRLEPAPYAKVAFNLLFSLRHLTRRNDLLEDWKRRWLDPHVLKRSRECEFNGQITDIERFHKSEMTAERFRDLFENDPRPIIIEGWADEFESFKWSLPWLRDNYGDDVLVVDTPDGTAVEKRLADVVDAVLAGEFSGHYLQNAADLFVNHPELVRGINVEAFEPYIRTPYLGTQMFLGGSSTGTNMHMANHYTMFYMIEGRKEWVLVRPEYAMWVYPYMHPDGLYANSAVDQFAPEEEIREKYPLYLQVPKVRAVVKPGDILFNPRCWWHATTNLTPISFSIANRWEPFTWDPPMQFPGAGIIHRCYGHPNTTYALLLELTPSMRAFRKERREQGVKLDDQHSRRKYGGGFAAGTKFDEMAG